MLKIAMRNIVNGEVSDHLDKLAGKIENNLRFPQMLLDKGNEASCLNPLHLQNWIPDPCIKEAVRQVLEANPPWLINRVQRLTDSLVTSGLLVDGPSEALNRPAPAVGIPDREDTA